MTIEDKVFLSIKLKGEEFLISGHNRRCTLFVGNYFLHDIVIFLGFKVSRPTCLYYEIQVIAIHKYITFLPMTSNQITIYIII